MPRFLSDQVRPVRGKPPEKEPFFPASGAIIKTSRALVKRSGLKVSVILPPGGRWEAVRKGASVEGGKRRGPLASRGGGPREGDNRLRPGKIEESADAARGVPAPPACEKPRGKAGPARGGQPRGRAYPEENRREEGAALGGFGPFPVAF
ncbi:hypothetical protein TthHB5018_20140 [Thermus thermophilus]|uniref:Uncharacterized protein n=1 Tax=Thermus thermophilus TaxID=274 RepID=A0A7R7TFP4_THETH|nr:hypothetical protein TthHB5018_20140 [Thermus thermophilus]